MVDKKVVAVKGPGSNHWVGDGFPVRNYFPSTGMEEEVSPFLLLDYCGPARFEPSESPRGVGEHPHRGFETVSIAYQGSVQHRDSGGNSGTIHPGDVQWMTAGSGVVHEEMHEENFARQGGTLEMVQLWVNLPSSHKMTSPRYQTLLSAHIPHLNLGSGKSYARVIAGEIAGVKGPASTFSPMTVLDIRLQAGDTAQIKLRAGDNSSVLLMHGACEIAGNALDKAAQIVLLDLEGDSLTIKATEDSTLLLMSGEPIREPIASYGPFVMNTKAELLEAIADYQAGKMGQLR